MQECGSGASRVPQATTNTRTLNSRGSRSASGEVHGTPKLGRGKNLRRNLSFQPYDPPRKTNGTGALPDSYSRASTNVAKAIALATHEPSERSVLRRTPKNVVDGGSCPTLCIVSPWRIRQTL